MNPEQQRLVIEEAKALEERWEAMGRTVHDQRQWSIWIEELAIEVRDLKHREARESGTRGLNGRYERAGLFGSDPDGDVRAEP